MNKYYAGIGSRKTPPRVLAKMSQISKALEAKGYCLRSGGAQGADTAFFNGCKNLWEIFGHRHSTPEAEAYVSEYHPAWERCNAFARRLHGRNAQIIMGEKLDKPVDFVVCWTPKGAMTGGTATGISMAQVNSIPVYNIAKREDYLALREMFKGL